MTIVETRTAVASAGQVGAGDDCGVRCTGRRCVPLLLLPLPLTCASLVFAHRHCCCCWRCRSSRTDGRASMLPRAQRARRCRGAAVISGRGADSGPLRCSRATLRAPVKAAANSTDEEVGEHDDGSGDEMVGSVVVAAATERDAAGSSYSDCRCQ